MENFENRRLKQAEEQLAKHREVTGAQLGMKEMRERLEEARATAGPSLQRDYDPVTQGIAPAGGIAPEPARVTNTQGLYPAEQYLAELIDRCRGKAKAEAQKQRELQALLDHLPHVLSADAEAGLWRLLRGL